MGCFFIDDNRKNNSLSQNNGFISIRNTIIYTNKLNKRRIAYMATQILYQKVAEDIKKNILSGTYEVGTLIPTENDLEKKYNVSKITVRKAVELLVAEGYLVKKSGIGTRVISNNLFNKLSKAKSYSSIVNEQGTLTKDILQITAVNSDDTPLKDRFKNQNIIFIKRLYRLDNEPFIIVEHYLPNINLQNQVEKLSYQSLYKFLQDNGKEPYKFKDAFSVTDLSKDDQKLLQTKAKTALKRIRYGYNDIGDLIEYTVSIYDSNKFPYEIEYEV